MKDYQTAEGKPLKTILCWSSGKDSAWTLHLLRSRPDIEVTALMTTVSETGRVPMHAVPVELVRRQADAVGLPLHLVRIPARCTPTEYATIMDEYTAGIAAEGVRLAAFGDLHLEWVREYREARLAESPVTPIFPLWGMPPGQLAREMIAGGLRTTIVSIDPERLPVSSVGRLYDEQFLADLAPEIDPCGEQGEFHTFAHDGPMFRHPVHFSIGAISEADGLARVELLEG